MGVSLVAPAKHGRTDHLSSRERERVRFMQVEHTTHRAFGSADHAVWRRATCNQPNAEQSTQIMKVIAAPTNAPKIAQLAQLPSEAVAAACAAGTYR